MTDTKFKYIPNNWYEITICPHDKYQFLKNGKTERYKRFRTFWSNVLQEQFTNYIMAYEVSMPQSSHKGIFPRLHIHGVFKFLLKSTLLNFIIEKFHHLADMALIQVNEYRPKIWPSYMCKDTKLMNKYAGYKNIVSSYSLNAPTPKNINKITSNDEVEQTTEVK